MHNHGDGGMIELHMRLKIRENKGEEIRQTLKSLGHLVRARAGCSRYSFYVRVRDNKGTVVQAWDGRTTFKSYLRSDEHRVLLGAISTLCSGCTVQYRGLEMRHLRRSLRTTHASYPTLTLLQGGAS